MKSDLTQFALAGLPQSLTRQKPTTLDDVLDWEFISKSLYSYKDLNPRRRIGSSLKEGLGDVVRDVSCAALVAFYAASGYR
jgi:chondroitin sulfate synthase